MQPSEDQIHRQLLSFAFLSIMCVFYFYFFVMMFLILVKGPLIRSKGHKKTGRRKYLIRR